MLDELLSALPPHAADPNLLVGNQASDDAAVYRLDDDRAIVATTDFFMPIVDDAYDFGCIAAANALSDVYAMGARPLLALAIAGVPLGKVPLDVVRRIFAGGQDVCRRAGVSVAGGHTIDLIEPVYGLAAVGVAAPGSVRRNADARDGDALVLGKPLGIGILGAAENKGELDRDAYAQMLATATRLNDVGIELAGMEGVHAMTDVTGYGLLGHLLETCRASGLGATLRAGDVPVLAAARDYAVRGYETGAGARNWASYGGDVDLPSGLPDADRNLLRDPQTSGGLLVSCAPESAGAVVRAFHAAGHEGAAVIGALGAGTPRVRVA